MIRVAVIGGGAAGMFAAIAAREHGDSDVTVFEGSRQLLGKVRISGGGRCNVTNYTLDVDRLSSFYPRGQRELRSLFQKFSVTDTIDWFRARGVALKVEPDGRMFPATDNSETIINCLLDTAETLGVKILSNVKVLKLELFEANFLITTSRTERPLKFDRVILTTGGGRSGYQLAQQCGHSIVEPVPSLFTFKVKDDRIKDLAGVSFSDVKLSLRTTKKFEQVGPLLITHWGFSGPALIKLSALAARALHSADYQAQLKINFLPQLSFNKALERLKAHRSQYPNRLVKADNIFKLPSRFWQRLVPGSSRWQEVSGKECALLAEELTSGEYQVVGKGVFKEEFVTCGGVSLKEVNFKNMESKVVAGLYFAGEVLDIDGLTGGFNFQAAWSAGWLAGKNAATGNATT